MSFIIDKEFQSYIRPLNESERSQLTANIIKEGCREPITVWNGIIIDGHHRYEICTVLGIPYRVRLENFHSRKEVLEWIIENQTGRRNLSNEEMAYYLGKLHEDKKIIGGFKGNRYTVKSYSEGKKVPLLKTLKVTKESTADKIAKQFKVSSKTIKEDVKYAKSVDKIAESLGHEYRAKILFGKILSKKDTIALSEENSEMQKQVVSKIEEIIQNQEVPKRIRLKSITETLKNMPSSVELVVAEVTCPECGTNYHLIHSSKDKHKLKKI